MIDLSRRLPDATVVLIHHSRKMGGGHGSEITGSNAYTANVDGFLSIKYVDGVRTMYGEGRDDVLLEPTVLTYEDGWYYGERKESVVRKTLAAKVYASLKEADEPMTAGRSAGGGWSEPAEHLDRTARIVRLGGRGDRRIWDERIAPELFGSGSRPYRLEPEPNSYERIINP